MLKDIETTLSDGCSRFIFEATKVPKIHENELPNFVQFRAFRGSNYQGNKARISSLYMFS